MRRAGDLCQIRSGGRLDGENSVGQQLVIVRAYGAGSLATSETMYFVRHPDGRQRFVREDDLEPLVTYTLEEVLALR